MISIIAAISEDNGIGYQNSLLWHLPEDLKRFKKLTLGHTVIMGKKTWESLPKKPLPGRINIVITDDPQEVIENSITAYSIEDALNKCGKEDEVFIIGGGSVYRQFMAIADRLYITHIHKKAQADIYFPLISPDTWETVEKEEHMADNNDDIPYTYIVYKRKNP
jgi:dihydrofolate reductase